MQINFSTNAALMSNSSFAMKNSPNFNGIAIEKPSVFKDSGDYGGEQGSYDIFVKTIEYRPYKDESEEEIKSNMESLRKPESCTNPKEYGGGEIITEKNVVLGEALNCTKEAAALILKYSK